MERTHGGSSMRGADAPVCILRHEHDVIHLDSQRDTDAGDRRAFLAEAPR
jgi:hypothetical protein